ncbi:MAG: hypothetical protein U0869_01430 [Chloroflexota bacterium]
MTLSGAAAFTSAGSYACAVTSSATGGVSIAYDSGSSFTIAGTADQDVLSFVCVGA